MRTETDAERGIGGGERLTQSVTGDHDRLVAAISGSGARAPVAHPVAGQGILAKLLKDIAVR
jgi:hypothetical protein